MGLGIGNRETGPPGAAAHLPALDLQMGSQTFNVSNQIPGCVSLQFRVRRGAPTPALVEQNDSIVIWVVRAPHCRVAATPRTTVQDHHRLALGIAAFFIEQRVDGRYGDVAGRVRGNLGIERAQVVRRRGGRGHKTDLLQVSWHRAQDRARAHFLRKKNRYENQTLKGPLTKFSSPTSYYRLTIFFERILYLDALHSAGGVAKSQTLTSSACVMRQQRNAHIRVHLKGFLSVFSGEDGFKMGAGFNVQ